MPPLCPAVLQPGVVTGPPLEFPKIDGHVLFPQGYFSTIHGRIGRDWIHVVPGTPGAFALLDPTLDVGDRH